MADSLALEVINTRLEPAAAEVTLQHMPDPLTASATDFTLEGQLFGPSGQAYPLAALPSEDGFVRCHAVVPDPAYWSPAAPHLYRAEVQLRHKDAEQSASLSWGFKTLTLSRKALWLNDEPLVLRGVLLKDVPDQPL